MGAPVILNVYDLHDNSWIYWCGIGEVRNTEGSHQGHPGLSFRRPFTSKAAWLCWYRCHMSFVHAGIFHSGVEVYDVEYAYGGERSCILPYGLSCLHQLGSLNTLCLR